MVTTQVEVVRSSHKNPVATDKTDGTIGKNSSQANLKNLPNIISISIAAISEESVIKIQEEHSLKNRQFKKNQEYFLYPIIIKKLFHTFVGVK